MEIFLSQKQFSNAIIKVNAYHISLINTIYKWNINLFIVLIFLIQLKVFAVFFIQHYNEVAFAEFEFNADAVT